MRRLCLKSIAWLLLAALGVPLPHAGAAGGGAGTGPGVTLSDPPSEDVPPQQTTTTPAPFVTVRSLTYIAVSFDEAVTGVNADDLQVNGLPAIQVTGSGTGPYTFVFPQPATGLVQVAWAPNPGIADTAAPPNIFPGGAWTYQLDTNLLSDFAIRHVVQMSLDGLGAKYLQFYLTNAPDQFPHFVRLMHEAAFTFNARCDRDISETVPNHATMFTGRPVLQPPGQANTVHHGYNNNFPGAADTLHNAGNANVPYKASMFDVAHDYGRATAFYAGKTRLGICDRSFNAVHGAPDLIGGDDGQDKIDFSSVTDVAGTSISNEVNLLLSDLTSGTPKHYSFIHIAEPDLTGHSFGWGSAHWSNAVRNVDAQIGRILAAIDSSAVLSNQTALVITADHGGGGVTVNGHTESSHITNYTVPLFIRGPGLAGGTDLYSLFANRGHPGTNRTDYNTQPQPLRNGDASNLALSLLGLPPIPGSSLVPVFATPSVALRVAHYGNQLSVFWSDPAELYQLESRDALTAAAAWQPVTNGLTRLETTKVLTITNATGNTRFYRLHKK